MVYAKKLYYFWVLDMKPNHRQDSILKKRTINSKIKFWNFFILFSKGKLQFFEMHKSYKIEIYKFSL